jgi:peptidoglycan/LPS O-acetylase OafA/YrhL
LGRHISTTTIATGTPSRTEAGRYRPDIDGLRAIAVTAVVAYHAFPKWAPGGFVGVDVFFVISGFLITRIIAGERDDGRFGFTHFYGRRARRILPAYFVMTAAVAVAAFAILLPQDRRMFGGTLGASGLFLTNVWFAATGVYFQPASRDSPLLHLWSLAVEEQFYLVWPLLILALSARWVRRVRPWLMLALALASLVLAEVTVQRGAAREAFYFLPGRAWEFLVGGLLAVGALAPPTRRFVANLAAVAGVALIVASLCLLDDNSAFPGLGALAPCLGAAAIIWSGSGEAPAASGWLRSAPMVGLGRISYSLYLWHWPPLVFARLILEQPLSPLLTVSLVALAVLLSALSWRFVEQPWRARQGRWRYVGFAIVCTLVLVAAGVGAYLGQGLPGRMPNAVVLEDTDVNPMRATCFLGWTAQETPPAACLLGDPAARGEVLVWGDSHADAAVPGVLAWAQAHGLRLLQATRSGCPPLTDAFVLVDGRNLDPGCRRFDGKVLAMAKSPAVRLVVLSARWPMYMNAKPPMGGYDPPMALVDAASGRATDLAAALDRTLTAIQASGVTARVLVVGPVPELPISPPNCMAQATRFGLDQAHCQSAPNADTLARANPAVAAIVRVAARHPAVRVILPSRELCAGSSCRAVADGDILYFDADHLSASGSRRLFPAWLNATLAGSGAGFGPPPAPK